MQALAMGYAGKDATSPPMIVQERLKKASEENREIKYIGPGVEFIVS
jgi:hypothetical protein